MGDIVCLVHDVTGRCTLWRETVLVGKCAWCYGTDPPLYRYGHCYDDGPVTWDREEFCGDECYRAK